MSLSNLRDDQERDKSATIKTLEEKIDWQNREITKLSAENHKIHQIAEAYPCECTPAAPVSCLACDIRDALDGSLFVPKPDSEVQLAKCALMLDANTQCSAPKQEGQILCKPHADEFRRHKAALNLSAPVEAAQEKLNG